MSVDIDSAEPDFLKKILDPEDKLESWTLIHSPYPVLSILLVYLLFIFKLGPSLMRSRPPIELNNTMRMYNLFQVLSNLFLIVRLLVNPAAMTALMRTQCSLEDLSTTSYSQELDLMLFYGWAYLLLKISDLLDTVFMVLKKKDSHITFLHVYHHTAMVFFVWLCFKHSKSHHGVIPALLNSSVHVVMYSYYFLATFPGIKERLWWKKHLTKFQLGQFVLVLVYFSVLYYNNCNIPRIFTYVWLFNVTVFSILFTNFYIKAYLTDSRSKGSGKSS